MAGYTIEATVMEVRKGDQRYIAKCADLVAEGRKTTPLNEVYTYELSESLGLGVVPKTLIAVVKGNGNFLCSVQEFVKGRVYNLREGKINNHIVATRIFVLDCLTGNTDRTFNNVLIDEAGVPWAIDNGFAVGFNFEEERAARKGMEMYDCDLLSRFSHLNVCHELLAAVDWEYAYKLVKSLQEKRPITVRLTSYPDYSARVNALLTKRLSFLEEVVTFQRVTWESLTNRRRTVSVDIDGVLAGKLDNGNYPDDYAKKERLVGVHEGLEWLRKHNYNIVLYTARREQDREYTARWLKEHKIDYDLLVMDKPFADFYIDDRAVEFYSWGDAITCLDIRVNGK